MWSLVVVIVMVERPWDIALRYRDFNFNPRRTWSVASGPGRSAAMRDHFVTRAIDYHYVEFYFRTELLHFVSYFRIESWGRWNRAEPWTCTHWIVSIWLEIDSAHAILGPV